MNKYFIMGFNKVAAPYTSASTSSSSGSSSSSSSNPGKVPSTPSGSGTKLLKPKPMKIKTHRLKDLGGVFGPAHFK